MYYHYGKWREVVLFSEVANVLSLWEVVLFSEVANVLSLWEVERGCPLLRGSTIRGTYFPCHHRSLLHTDSDGNPPSSCGRTL